MAKTPRELSVFSAIIQVNIVMWRYAIGFEGEWWSSTVEFHLESNKGQNGRDLLSSFSLVWTFCFFTSLNGVFFVQNPQ